MDHHVGVAADRRGEVRVDRRGEACRAFGLIRTAPFPLDSRVPCYLLDKNILLISYLLDSRFPGKLSKSGPDKSKRIVDGGRTLIRRRGIYRQAKVNRDQAC